MFKKISFSQRFTTTTTTTIIIINVIIIIIITFTYINCKISLI